ncbi:MAG: hypothetical protein RLZZ555_1802 [Pseudomonadota bacterium]
MMYNRRRVLHSWLACSIVLPLDLRAALPQAGEKVVLTVRGSIGRRSAQEQASFDIDMIEALPQHGFSTMTPWYKQPVSFSGPLLRDLLAAVDAKGSQITAIALNDYKVVIPFDDARRFDVIVATRMDGKPIPVRTKGPLFVIYPFDQSPQLQTVRYHERSIWQLKALEIH